MRGRTRKQLAWYSILTSSLIILLSLVILSEPFTFRLSANEYKRLSKRQIVEYLNQIEIEIKSGNFQRARKLLDQVLYTDPENLTAIYYDGVLLYYYHRYDEALKRFEQVKNRMNRFPDAYLLSAICEEELGKLTDALNDIDLYLRRMPNSELGRLRKAIILWKLGNTKCAIEELEELCKLYPHFTLAYLLKCDYLTQLGRYEEAQNLYLKLYSKLTPKERVSSGLLLEMGWFFFLKGEPKRALMYIDELLNSTDVPPEDLKLARGLKELLEGNLDKSLNILRDSDEPRAIYLKLLISIKLSSYVPAYSELSYRLACQLYQVEPYNLVYRQVYLKLRDIMKVQLRNDKERTSQNQREDIRDIPEN